MTGGLISPRLRKWWWDRIGDWDQERFWGGVGGYGRGGGDDDIALGTILMRINKNNKCITNTPIYTYFNQNKKRKGLTPGAGDTPWENSSFTGLASSSIIYKSPPLPPPPLP